MPDIGGSGEKPASAGGAKKPTAPAMGGGGAAPKPAAAKPAAATPPAAPKPAARKPTPKPKAEPVMEVPRSGMHPSTKALLGIIIIVIILAGVYALFRVGVEDLKDDNTYLIVIELNGVAKSATLYTKSTDTSKQVNIAPYPPVQDTAGFFAYAELEQQAEIDRMVVINILVITALSRGEALQFRGEGISPELLAGYISGATPIPNRLEAGDLAEWQTKTEMFSTWVEKYKSGLLETGSQDFFIVLSEYRAGRIDVYPFNWAMVILRYIPLEALLF